MSTPDRPAIEEFLHEQVAHWNAGNREGFFAAYRRMAPRSLTIEYVGRPAIDGWKALEAMWEQQSAKVEIEELTAIINGAEAACHNRNKVRGTAMAVETIELYRFNDGEVTVRYFIKQ